MSHPAFSMEVLFRNTLPEPDEPGVPSAPMPSPGLPETKFPSTRLSRRDPRTVDKRIHPPRTTFRRITLFVVISSPPREIRPSLTVLSSMMHRMQVPTMLLPSTVLFLTVTLDDLESLMPPALIRLPSTSAPDV